MPTIDPNLTWRLLEERLADEKNPRFRHQLETVILHMKSEAVGDRETVMSTLSPTSAKYLIYDNLGEPTVMEGRPKILAWYEALPEVVDLNIEFKVEQVVVDDDVVITQGPLKRAIRGSALAKQIPGGDVVDDPNTFYLANSHHLIVWPFASDGLLVGEHIFRGYTQPPEEVAKQPLRPGEIGTYNPAAA
jgi:hypothetical protein